MEGSEIVWTGLALLALAIAYFLPTIVANSRGRQGQVGVGIGNLLLGWTVIGWIVLLVIAFTGESKSQRQQREALERMASK